MIYEVDVIGIKIASVSDFDAKEEVLEYLAENPTFDLSQVEAEAKEHELV